MATTRTELLELIHNGESSGVEFKRDDIQNQDFARELVALTNLEGGFLLLGVEDDGSVSVTIALTDATPDNGAVSVLPGVHRHGTAAAF